MRVQYDLREMMVWGGLSDAERQACVDEARRFLVTTKRWASSVKWPDHPIRHVGDGVHVPTIEDENPHLLERLDRTIKRHLDELREAKVDAPLTPFYVAVWKEAQALEDDAVQGFEEAMVLAMARVQSTALLVGAFKANPSDSAMRAELVKRQLLRR